MSSDILLSILTPSIPSRFAMVQALHERLKDQIGDLPVEHLIFTDNKRRSIGMKREALVQIASGRFVAFLDDDDFPARDYVAELVKAIRSNPDVDVVVFNQHTTINGKKFTVRFGLEYDNQQAQIGDDGEFFDITRKPFHVCAWHRSLAKRYHFPDTMDGEDWAWCKQMLVEARTQTRVEKVLHTYRFDEKITEAKSVQPA